MQIDIENNTQGNNIRSISRGIYCPTKDSVSRLSDTVQYTTTVVLVLDMP